MSIIKVKYKDKEYEYESGIKLEDIAKDFKDNYKYKIILGSINNKTCDLNTEVNRDSKIDFYDYSSKIGNNSFQKGLSFLFSKAVRDVLNCDVKMMHTINQGIYCEILTNNIISEVTVQKIKIRMKELNDSKISINKILVSRMEAIEYYNKINQTNKASSLRFISNSNISLYKMDDTLDYYYGPLPNNTSLIDKYNIKYINDNKVILLYPNMYDLESDLKFNRNDKLLEVLEKNDKYNEDLRIYTSVELNKTISTGFYGDLIRVSEAISNNNLFDITEDISKDKNIKMVLITGPSSSGKTTTARKLTLFLKSRGLKPIPVSVDDFYINLKDRVLDENGEPEKEKISAIDTNLFNKKISELLEGKEVTLPRYNFVKGISEEGNKKIKMNEKSILVIEGIHAFNEKLTEMIPDKNKFKLFICPLSPLNVDNHNIFKETDNRLLRRIVRDNKTRGYSASDTLGMWKNVRKAEEEMVLPYMKDADFIFNTSLIYELGVLKTYAEPLLFSVNEDDPNYGEAIRLINLFRLVLGMPSDLVPNDSIIREFIGGSCFKD